jgi:hypothetical protein
MHLHKQIIGSKALGVSHSESSKSICRSLFMLHFN